MTSEIKVDTISENTSANGVTIDGLTIKDGNIIGDVALAGTTPTFTIGDAGAEDAALIFDGNAQDFYIALDDSADDLIIGLGAAVGTTPMLSFTEAKAAAFTGVVTANAGVVVDNITIDGTEIDLSSGDLTLDVEGDIILDGNGGNIKLRDGGSGFGQLKNSSSDFIIQVDAQDKDIFFKGDDGGAAITALTLDMSDAGTASFNHDIKLGDNSIANFGASNDLQIFHDATNGFSGIKDTGTGPLVLLSNNVLIQNAAGAENMIKALDGGAVELYYDNNKKLETTAAGVTLQGGIAIGGTGSANLLDDYEEGTWDPAATFNDDGATGHGGKYTKIGNVVTATFSITFGSTSFGAVISISGLPFSATTQSGLGIGGAMIKGYYDGSSTNLSGYIGDNTSQIDLRENEVHLTHNSDKILGKNLRGTAVYHVN